MTDREINECLAQARKTAQEFAGLTTQELDVHEHLDLLNSLRKQAEWVTTSVLRFITDSHDHPRYSELQSEMIRFFSRQAAGYKTIAYNGDLVRNANKGYGAKSILTSSVYWAIHFHSLSLLFAYSGYRRHPAGIWCELHRLYQHACFFDVEYTEGNTEPGPDSADTIHTAYLKIVLLGLVDPYKLPEGTLEKVHTWILLWFDEAKFLSPSQAAGVKGCIVVDCDIDRPGVAQRPDQPILNDRRHWLVDCGRIDSLISDQIRIPLRTSDLPRPANYIELRRWKRALLIIHRQLIRSPSRQFERIQKDQPVTVSLVDLTGDKHQQDLIIRDSFNVLTVDYSLSGMRLVMKADSQIVTGQLLRIAVEEKNSPDSMAEELIGVVRWRKHDESSQLILGVKLLGKLEQQVELFKSGTNSGGRIKTIMINNDHLSYDAAPLVCVPCGYKRNSLFNTTDPGESVTWRIVDRVEAADTADCYSVEVYE